MPPTDQNHCLRVSEDTALMGLALPQSRHCQGRSGVFTLTSASTVRALHPSADLHLPAFRKRRSPVSATSCRHHHHQQQQPMERGSKVHGRPTIWLLRLLCSWLDYLMLCFHDTCEYDTYHRYTIHDTYHQLCCSPTVTEV